MGIGRPTGPADMEQGTGIGQGTPMRVQSPGRGREIGGASMLDCRLSTGGEVIIIGGGRGWGVTDFGRGKAEAEFGGIKVLLDAELRFVRTAPRGLPVCA